MLSLALKGPASTLNHDRKKPSTLRNGEYLHSVRLRGRGIRSGKLISDPRLVPPAHAHTSRARCARLFHVTISSKVPLPVLPAFDVHSGCQATSVASRTTRRTGRGKLEGAQTVMFCLLPPSSSGPFEGLWTKEETLKEQKAEKVTEKGRRCHWLDASRDLVTL